MRARQKKKNYKKIHGCNPPKPADYDSVINSIVEVMPGTISALEKMIKDVISETNKLINNIKEMPEEEFNEKILRSELTPEQITMAKTIRYRNGKSK